MNVIFMGTPDFAVPCLQKLIKNHNVIAVFSQPDKPVGRKQVLMPTPIKACAIEHNIDVFQPTSLKNDDVSAQIENMNADVIVVVAYGKILPKRILEAAKYGCINVHASLLPEYRGAAPIQWAVIDGKKESGVTTMYMAEGLDTGDIIDKKIVELDKKETGGSLFDKLAITGGSLILETLEKLENNTAVTTPQDDDKSTYAGKITKELGHIDFTKSAEEIERLIRGLNPWPSAFSHLNGKTLKIWEASVEEENGEKKAPGTVLQADAKGFRIQTGEGILKIDTLQMEGKKRMDAQAFLRGYTVEEGMILPC